MEIMQEGGVAQFFLKSKITIQEILYTVMQRAGRYFLYQSSCLVPVLRFWRKKVISITHAVDMKIQILTAFGDEKRLGINIR